MHGMNDFNSPGYNFDNMSVYNQSFTNIIFVTSVEEALFRASSRNSEMVFFQQDRPVFYRIKVDNEGRKSWAEYDYGVKSSQDNSPVTRAEMSELMKKVAALEEKFKVTEGDTINEQHE